MFQVPITTANTHSNSGNECSEDDVVHPSDEWGTGLDGVTAFINDDTGGKPPLFESKDVNVMVRCRYALLDSTLTGRW